MLGWWVQFHFVYFRGTQSADCSPESGLPKSAQWTNSTRGEVHVHCKKKEHMQEHGVE